MTPYLAALGLALLAAAMLAAELAIERRGHGRTRGELHQERRDHEVTLRLCGEAQMREKEGEE